MTDPLSELQKILVAALRDHEEVGSYVADRIYDRVPENTDFPFISIGNISLNSDYADDVDILDANLNIHVWTQSVGAVEARKIAWAVREALHLKDFDADWPVRILLMEHMATRTSFDNDRHRVEAIVTFDAIIQNHDNHGRC